MGFRPKAAFAPAKNTLVGGGHATAPGKTKSNLTIWKPELQ